jgi:hypothetical protein
MKTGCIAVPYRFSAVQMSEPNRKETHPERTKGGNGPTHLVQLFWADVGAIGKSKINQRPFPQQTLLSEGLVVVCE